MRTLVVSLSLLVPVVAGGDACIPADRCCRVCDVGQACGDTCIDRDNKCRTPKGCACDEADVCAQPKEKKTKKDTGSHKKKDEGLPLGWIALGVLGVAAGGAAYAASKKRTPQNKGLPSPSPGTSTDPLPTGRILVVPRWGATGDSDFYPWLERALPATLVMERLSLPGHEKPEIERWVPALLAALGPDPRDTVIVAHSVGAQAALRALARLPEGARVRGLLCVAGWWTIDEPWDSIGPWMELDFEPERAARAAGWISVLLSDNDPYTADHARTAALFRDRLGATVRVVPGAAHFNDGSEPQVVSALKERWS